MAKLKTAILRAQETADITGAGKALTALSTDLMLWIARDTLTEGIVSPDADVRIDCAERALHLINTYLLESELCKR
jgi:hypothetical protein